MSSPTGSIPEFSTLEARGTLRIPLQLDSIPRETPAATSDHQVDCGKPLPISKLESSHQPISPATGRTQSLCQSTLFGGQIVPAVELVCDASPEAPAKPENLEIDNRLEALQLIAKSDFGQWIERLRDAGIHAARATSPDLLGQLSLAIKRPIDTVVCNLLDSDPAACLNAALGARYPREIVAALLLITKLTGAEKCLICADQRISTLWSSPLRNLIRKSLVRWVFMSNDYPQSDPTLLLYSLLNRRLRPERSPVEQGVILLDAAAAYAIGRLILADEPMTHIPLAVQDHVTRRSHFALAPVGLPLADLLGQLGLSATNSLLRGGALLRDRVLPSDAVVSGSELVIHLSDREPDINPDACIRCGWCNEACPTRVQPAVILEAAQRNSIELAERAGIEACIECGICSYVCPSRLPLLEGIRAIRASATNG